ncbi:uncharacterized protein LOC110722187 [Chenopodium quinoa]|uniref:uncharacterized protein LOC110722187 n=1 Tax=Chenopodium quinoa TaxID=63459 RepID=UPI000B78A22A|nr:uncharacterized protein LOC110722187 [Chenopodium quinoa]
MVSNVTKSHLPRNPSSALRDPNWKMAMDDEFNALINNKTWELVPHPPDVNVIRSMLIFTHKNDFLHGELKETVYVHQPLGFRDRTHPDYMCLPRKSLYGLKWAPRAWYKRFADFVAFIGFTTSRSDTSLFIYRVGKDVAYLMLYVDDIILTTSNDALRRSIMFRLSSEFSMKDFSPLDYFLGIIVTRHKGGLFLSQQRYAEEIIDRAGRNSCKPSATPVEVKPKISASDSPFADLTLYRSLGGALQYRTFRRPDTSYPCNSLHLYPSSNSSLISYTDANWGGCPDTRRSKSEYCVFLGDNLISWSSKCQDTLSKFSVEAEYRGVANVVSESCWIRNLLLELHCPIKKDTLVYFDNVSAISLLENRQITTD